jgi:BarA-like signal transduction histidine kinase
MIEILYTLFVSEREPMANTELWLTKGVAMRHFAPVIANCGCKTFCTLQQENY